MTDNALLDRANAQAQIDDKLKSMEQARDFTAEQFFQSLRLYLEQSHAERVKAYDGVVLWGGNTVRTLFLLNGGSILAFITFTGSLIGKGDKEAMSRGIEFAQLLLPAFVSFIAGVCLTAVVAGIAYLNFSAAYNVRPQPVDAYKLINKQDASPPAPHMIKILNTTFIFAAILSCSSLVCFIVGCGFVYAAINALDI